MMLSKHTIRTGDAPPQRQRSYQHSPAARREIERQTADMLANDIIQPSESVWSAPLLLIKKKTGDTRMCMDYRRLNSVTKQISFPLPRLQEVFDTLTEGQPKFFTLCDLKSRYHQILLDPATKEKTTFVTHQ